MSLDVLLSTGLVGLGNVSLSLTRQRFMHCSAVSSTRLNHLPNFFAASVHDNKNKLPNTFGFALISVYQRNPTNQRFPRLTWTGSDPP